MGYFLLNGTLHADDRPLIWPQDRGLLLADGLFETLKVVQGAPCYVVDHFQRLQCGLAALGLCISYSAEQLIADVALLWEKNSFNITHTLGSARLTITRGVGNRGLNPPNPSQPTVLLTASVAAPVTDDGAGVSLVIASGRKNEYSGITHFKSLAYTEAVIARQEAIDQGADDALFLNTQERVVGTTTANIFLYQHGILCTPALTEGALPGVMRKQIIQQVQSKGHAVQERPITLADCYQAEAVFLTNVLIGKQPVRQIGEYRVPRQDLNFI